MVLVPTREEEDSLKHWVHCTERLSLAGNDPSAGKPIAEGVNTLSADRRTFEEVSWSPGKPGKRVTLIYERQ